MPRQHLRATVVESAQTRTDWDSRSQCSRVCPRLVPTGRGGANKKDLPSLGNNSLQKQVGQILHGLSAFGGRVGIGGSIDSNEPLVVMLFESSQE